MGFGKRYKKFTGNIGQAFSELTGSEAVGRGAAIVAGSFTGSIPGMLAASQGFSNELTKETQAKAAKTEFQNQQNILNAQLAQAQQQAILSQEDLKRMEEEKKRQTTFAGSSLQNIIERRKLGV